MNLKRLSREWRTRGIGIDKEYLEKVNEQYGTTMIIVTHESQLENAADNLVKVEKNNGISKVSN